MSHASFRDGIGAAYFEGFNISTPVHDRTRARYADLAKINGDAPLRLVSDPPYERDVRRRVPSVEKGVHVLGVRCRTPLNEVIPWIERAVVDRRI